jgi:hypothetical protein
MAKQFTVSAANVGLDPEFVEFDNLNEAEDFVFPFDMFEISEFGTPIIWTVGDNHEWTAYGERPKFF